MTLVDMKIIFNLDDSQAWVMVLCFGIMSVLLQNLREMVRLRGSILASS